MSAPRKQMVISRTVIGVAERVDLPDWGVRRLRAKIDTGARTSALHVDHIEELDDHKVRFSIVLHRSNRDKRVTVEAEVIRRSRVRSSTGRSQERIIVATRVVIGGVEREIEISLASRRRMIFRMLLGRSALADAFLIDPSRRYVCARKPKGLKTTGLKTKRNGRAPTPQTKRKKTSSNTRRLAKRRAALRGMTSRGMTPRKTNPP